MPEICKTLADCELLELRSVLCDDFKIILGVAAIRHSDTDKNALSLTVFFDGDESEFSEVLFFRAAIKAVSDEIQARGLWKRRYTVN
jgi:hypothetical protein